MLGNHIKIAFRNLLRRKLYTLINVLGLVLGITCSLVIYTCIKYELGFDSFHSNSKNIYRVVETHRAADAMQYWNTTAYPLAAALRNDFPELKVTQAAGPQRFVVSNETETGRVNRFEENKVLFADADYLTFFDFKKAYPAGNFWIAGNAQTAFRDPAGVVLTESLAARYFPLAKDKRSIIGRTIKIDNGFLITDITITGIVKDPPANTNLLFDMLINYEVFRKNNTYQANNWSGNYEGTTYLQLPPNISPVDIEKRLPSFEKKYLNAEDNRIINYFLQPLKNIHTEPLYGDSPGSYVISKTTLWSLGGLAVFLILIASFNFINLSTAQTAKRSKEVGVRKVIGGTRLQLFTQFMTEMILITFISALLSLIALYGSLSYINQNLSIINMHLQVDYSIFIFAFLLIIVLALLAGFYPSFILSGYKPVSVLKSKFAVPGKSGLSFRHGLIVLQFSIAFFLIAGTLVIVRQIHYFLNKDLGFARDAVLTINIPRQDQGKIDALRQELLRNPNIKNMSYASGTPISTRDHYGTGFRLQEEPVNMMRQAEMKVVDLNYMSLYNLRLVAGRWLNESNKRMTIKEGFNGFVVNETLVNMLGLKPEDAIGKEIIINEGKAPIVGVISDFHNNSLQKQISPCLLFYWGADFFGEAGIQLYSGNGNALSHTLDFIEKTWKKTFPESIYNYRFRDEALARNYVQETLTSKAFQLFAGIAIFISCLGLFGLVVFATEQRTKEIGVRKVLGASVASIVSLLSKDFLKPVLAAILLASPVAWFMMNKWLEDFAYRIHISGWLFVLAACIAVGIALMTVGFHAVKAAAANPVKALRTE